MRTAPAGRGCGGSGPARCPAERPRAIRWIALLLLWCGGCAQQAAAPPPKLLDPIDLTGSSSATADCSTAPAEAGAESEGAEQCREAPLAPGEVDPLLGPSAPSEPEPSAEVPSDGVPIYQVTVPAPTRANPSRGPASARVVVQLFSDFECPFCRAAASTIDALGKEFPDDVRTVWRNLPISYHPHARLAATAAMEAFAQRGDDAFWAMHDLLYENARSPGGLEQPALERYATELGLDLGRFRRALQQGTHDAAIDRDIAIAKAAGVTLTPAVVIGDLAVFGAEPLSVYRQVVRLALQRGHGAPAP
jgi:protein-disulfide isomerase